MFTASDNPVIIEPFKIKSVEPLPMTSREEREQYLQEAHYNPFLLHSSQVTFDFLTDSGTSAMSSAQWAAMMDADESYAGAKSWEHLYRVVNELTGYPHILPTHQGRAAERILYGVVGGKGKVFLSNTHFDTTRANIEFTGATAIDIPIKEGLDPFLIHPFKGNMDTEALEKNIQQYGASAIGAVILTVTNNSGGGQPVSMANAKEVSRICKKHNVLFVLDACRIAENAYFIRHREEGYADQSDFDIAREMFRLADAAIMSAKKDALVNMGGFLAMNDEKLAQQCSNLLIITEGFTTYGGLSGRDMEAIAVGLKEVFVHGYLTYRIRSTAYLGEKLIAKGIPVMQPIGGHAVYIDARTFYPNIPVDQYPGQALVCELYKVGGIRAVEVGSLMFGKYDEKGKLIPSAMDLVRLAIPRRVYTQSHIDYVIALFDELIREKEKVKGYKIVFETPLLRHFTCKLKPVI
ncbi:MAG TPA: tryptophanase [Cyclobacteriaceae bacterium]|nr:tryptophanase [Cyclobacteriaceae bacterium]HRJ83527.1 tryptophanase [Cyclobacteriaceae bacterium]